MSTLAEMDIQSLSYVCMNLRASDRDEIFGLRPHDSPLVLAYEMHAAMRNSGRGRIAWHDGKPTAVVGFAEFWPGTWQVILAATPDFRHVARDCLRWVRQTATDLIENHGGRRLQCDSHIEHEEAHRFLKALGAIPEGPPMKRYGKTGDAYQRFVWLAGMNDHFITKKERPDVFHAQDPRRTEADRPAVSA